MLADRLHNVRHGSDKENLDDNQLSVEDIKAMVQTCRAVLKHGGHSHLFYTALHSGQRHPELLKESEEEEVMHDDGEQGMQKKENGVSLVVEVEPILLRYTRLWGRIIRARVCKARHTSCAFL